LADDQEYSMGQTDEMLGFLRWRTAERNCSFMREFVQTDSDILDCGCGPGSITLGLAQWAPDGQTVGMDYDADAAATGTKLAERIGVKNIRFETGDIFQLPFDDECFDIVFSQTVLCHIPNRDAAIGEMKRVLKSGGVIALCDITRTQFQGSPEDPSLEISAKIFNAGQLSTGGDPEVGGKLGTMLKEAGFDDVFMQFALPWQPLTVEEQKPYYDDMARALGPEAYGKTAIDNGWVSPEEVAALMDALDNMAQAPWRAVAPILGQAVGHKP
jgi:SAM-dependent methyltransferase